MTRSKLHAPLAVYLVGFSLTFGVVSAQHHDYCRALHDNPQNPDVERQRRNCVILPGFLAGTFWPMYWPTKIVYVVAQL